MSHTIEISYPSAGVAQVTFADPARQNQLCWAAVDALAQALADCREAGARVLILASGLDGHWFEHAWLQDLLSGLDGEPQTGSGSGWFQVQQELARPEVVSIAAISGDCSGGGAELGWACDLRIAEQQARFSQPEVNMGLTTGIGGCSRLSRLVGRPVAAEMVLTGRPMSASRLYELGALNQVVAPGQALVAACSLAATLSARPAVALQGLKQILDEGRDVPLHEALTREQTVFQAVVVSDAARQGMRRVQDAYDAGASIESANGYAAWSD